MVVFQLEALVEKAKFGGNCSFGDGFSLIILHLKVNENNLPSFCWEGHLYGNLEVRNICGKLGF